VPAAFLAQKPAGLSHVESAALPLAGLTAWQGLFVHGELQPNQRVLILGATAAWVTLRHSSLRGEGRM
jgi:NADPH:quinone reductase-like Zn-dependent oxidoreductase